MRLGKWELTRKARATYSCGAELSYVAHLKEISRVEKDDVVAAAPSRSTGRPEGGREGE